MTTAEFTAIAKALNDSSAYLTSGLSAGSHPFTLPKGPEPLEWTNFAMWIRGFLDCQKGKVLDDEAISKIMDKLATVDPEAPGTFPRQSLAPQYVSPAIVPFITTPTFTKTILSNDSTSEL